MTPIPLDSTSSRPPSKGATSGPARSATSWGLGRPYWCSSATWVACSAREWLAELEAEVAVRPAFPTRPLLPHGDARAGGCVLLSPTPRGSGRGRSRSVLLRRRLGVPSASPLQLLDPRVWACGIRATRRGHKPGKPVGDPLVMPGPLPGRGEPGHLEIHPRADGRPPQAGRRPSAGGGLTSTWRISAESRRHQGSLAVE